MTTVQLPDEMAQELMTATGQPTPEAAMLQVVQLFLKSQRDMEYLQARAARGSREAFDAAMAHVPSVPPLPGDELPERKQEQ